MEAGIATLIHGDLATIAGIEMILTSVSLHQFLCAGDTEALGGGLVSLEFLCHTGLDDTGLLKFRQA